VQPSTLAQTFKTPNPIPFTTEGWPELPSAVTLPKMNTVSIKALNSNVVIDASDSQADNIFLLRSKGASTLDLTGGAGTDRVMVTGDFTGQLTGGKEDMLILAGRKASQLNTSSWNGSVIRW
jgi:hypothetical protein